MYTMTANSTSATTTPEIAALAARHNLERCRPDAPLAGLLAEALAAVDRLHAAAEAQPDSIRSLLDDGPDFEDSAEWSLDDIVGIGPDPASVDAWLYDDTPVETLARQFEMLPPVSGGAPEPFVPSEADWADYHAWREKQDQADASEEAHRCGFGR